MPRGSRRTLASAALHCPAMRVRIALVALCLMACSGGSEGTRGVAGKASRSASSKTSMPRIWVLAVGVSKYREASLALEFADRDATAIDSFFASPVGGSVPEERRVLLVNDGATRAAVLPR